MRSQTRSLIVKLIDRLKPVDAALELRRILNDDLADTIERKARF
jgi:hypothetical protein